MKTIMRIEITHNNKNRYKWDSFSTHIVDDNAPSGSRIKASATGDWEFISGIVYSWVKGEVLNEQKKT